MMMAKRYHLKCRKEFYGAMLVGWCYSWANLVVRQDMQTDVIMARKATEGRKENIKLYNFIVFASSFVVFYMEIEWNTMDYDF